MPTQVLIVNQQTDKLNQKQILADLARIQRRLQKQKLRQKPRLKKSLTLVFLSASQMRKINLQFRGKSKVTDILSFQTDPRELGELVLCVPQIKLQAKQHKLSFREELNYMLVHGLLHLLGYDHEASHKEEQVMLGIQDEVFDSLRASL